MTTIQRHLIGRLIVATFIVVPGVCVPLTILALFREVPSRLLYSKALWTILNAIVPTELYLTLPIGLAIAVTWWYETLVSDYAVDVLYSAGYSPFAVISPAVVVALLGTAVCLGLSCVVAPHGAARLYDLIYDFQHSLAPTNLEPRKFYEFDIDDQKHTIFFESWIDANTIRDVFVRETEDNGKQTVITAPTGQFIETVEESYLYLLDGVYQSSKWGEAQSTMIHFDNFLVSFGLRGGGTPQRPWTGIAELGPVEFLGAYANFTTDRKKMQWTSEALRRFGAPFLTLAYTLIGVGLVLHGLGIRRDNWWRLNAICVLLVINHAVVMSMAEGVINMSAKGVWIILSIIVIEMIAGLVLARFKISKGMLLFPSFGIKSPSGLTAVSVPQFYPRRRQSDDELSE